MSVAKSKLTNYEALPLYNDIKEELKKNKRERLFKRRKRQRMIFKLACIASIALFTVVCFFVLKGYSDISQTRLDITRLERSRNELEQTKFSILSELEEAKSSVKINEEAMYKLSMDYPGSDQVVYISLGKSKDN